MINQHEWLRARKNLLDQVKSQVEVRLGPAPKTLRQYAKKLDKEFAGSWKSCSEPELRAALSRVRIVLSADFHAYAQSQRAHIRLLRDYIKQDKVVLLLECLSTEANSEIKSFLEGRLTERKFLEAVNWEANWGFPWENYRPLFEFARDRGFEVAGLNTAKLSSLRARDLWMNRQIRQHAKKNPEALIYVVVGETHLAATHLPKLLHSSRKKDGEVATIFQDVEKLYFRLARRRQEGHIDFLRSRGNRFCFMVSPPWMKWQSYLMYLEQAYDRELQDDPGVDYTDHVASLVEVLEGDLKVKVPRSHLQVFGPTSKAPLARLRAGLPKRFAAALLYHLEHDLSFLIPERQWLYLSRPTINHASSLAGQFLHAHLSRRRRTLWRMPKDFLPLIWVEALGFFFSKWINPKRKADTLESLRLQLKARHPGDRGRQALLLSLDHRLSEVVFVQTGRSRRRKYRPRDIAAFVDATRIVGSMMGERLYQMVRAKSVTQVQLLSYLKVDIEANTFEDFYWRLIKELEPHEKVR